MSSLKFIQKDILTYTTSDTIIVQQTNTIVCNSIGKGLAEAITTRFPYCNPYTRNSKSDIGTCAIFSPDTSTLGPHIACLMAQIRPGRANKSNDSAQNRLQFFRSALDELLAWLSEEEHRVVTKIAFPLNIGCGLAGGKWEDYFEMIRGFGLEFERFRSGGETVICCLGESDIS